MHRESKPLIAAACLGLAPIACTHSPAQPAQAQAQAGEAAAVLPSAAGVAGIAPGIVDGATGHRLAAAGVQVVDVRSPGEFESSHVPGAKNIPVDQLGARAAELGSPSTPVLLYCRSGHRAGIAREMLQRMGFTAVYDMQTLAAW